MTRRTLIGLPVAGLVSACLPEPQVTRDAPDPFEGGIGGTGIVGVMTDFGSLIVNGLRLEVVRATSFRTAFGVATEADIAPGHSLSVVATRELDRLVAREVVIDRPLIGTLRGGSVNGVPVRFEAGAPGAAVSGTRLALSGVWTPSGLSVSRADPAGDALDAVAGTVSAGGPTGTTIGGAPVRLGGAPPAQGSYLVARGRFRGGVLEAAGMREGRFPRGADSLRQLSVDGYLEPIARAPDFRIAGLGHSFDRGLDLAALATSRAIYFGRYDGLFRAARGYVVPEGFAARRAMLVDGFAGGHEAPVIRTLR